MSDLREVIDKLSKREISRKQFLTMIGGSFFGMLGVFHIMQSFNTPEEEVTDLATSRREVFGEREYGGYLDVDAARHAKQPKAKAFDEDVFG